jgi:hypothetical protein
MANCPAAKRRPSPAGWARSDILRSDDAYMGRFAWPQHQRIVRPFLDKHRSGPHALTDVDPEVSSGYFPEGFRRNSDVPVPAELLFGDRDI